TASITLSKETDIYGMPDSLFMEAVGSGYRASYYYVLDHAYGLCQVPAFSDSTLQKKKAAIRTSQFKQEDYPIPLASIRLNVERDPSYVSGNHYNGTFWLKGIYAVYPEKDVQNQILIPKQKSELLVFPNPATDGFYIQANQNKRGLFQLNMYAITGELIRNETIHINESGKTPYISVNDLQPGIYFIFLKGADSTFAGRVIFAP
ncbi:MAG: T9SS type A sorting domain-containing protein, partial [Bacteroidales bacterium]|nr:T9SS type A sorting domain-containing protein [Bacteroidales bacterium]